MNKHQRRAQKRGEQRVSGAEIWRLVELSKSNDAKHRLEAANNLCPCHVRRRIDDVWNALFTLLEDPDVQVRRAAYHTLDDGGDLSHPALGAIFERARNHETHPKLRRRIERFLQDRQNEELERADFMQAARVKVGDYPERGKCDFCGSHGAVKKDLETPIPNSSGSRPAMVCDACDR